MYNVSQAYRSKIFSLVHRRRIVGTLDGISFTTEDVMRDSLSLRSQMASGADVRLGGVFASTLSLTFLRSFADNISRKTWRGKVINISVGLNLHDDVWEDVPLGVFVIDDATHSATGVTITAYDNMLKFDKDLVFDQSSGYPYDFLNACCTACHVTLGMTRAQVEALPNGNQYLGIYEDNDMTTYRDLVSWTACTLCGYATIDRTGKLVVRTFKTEVDLTIGIYHRGSGGIWSDFDTYFTGASLVNIADETTEYYGIEQGDTGLTMNIGSNPLLQYGSDTDRETRVMNIVNALVDNFVYTPFKNKSFLDPAIDLGDIIEYTDGLAGTSSIGMVMKITYTFNKGVVLEGFGRNPAQYGAQSKTDKNIAGLMSKETGNQYRITIISFTNVADVAVGSSWRQLAHMRIGVMESQTALLHGVVKITLNSAGTVYIRYKLNGDVLPFIHVCQFPIGEDTITLFLPLAISNEFVNDLKVEIMSTDGAGIVAVGDGNITLQGVGVTTGAWDGYIEIADEFAFPFRAGLGFSYTDDAEVETNSNAISVSASDSFAFPLQAGIGFSYSETQDTRVTLESLSFKLTVESGDGHLLTEEGGENIITEG